MVGVLVAFIRVVYGRMIYMPLPSPTKLFTYESCYFLTSALISLLEVSNFDLSLLLPVFFFCLCMSFIFPANLPSYLRCNPGN